MDQGTKERRAAYFAVAAVGLGLIMASVQPSSTSCAFAIASFLCGMMAIANVR